MTLAAYPSHAEYKASGHKWVGDVPAHWSVEKLGTCLTAVSRKGRPDLPLLSITREGGVVERDVDDQESNHNFIPEDLSNYKVMRAGQFGMNKMKAWQGSYGISDHTGIVSPAYFVFDITREVDPAFFNRALRSKLYVSYFAAASDGVRIGQWDLSKIRMREIPILLPPLAEQRAIAAFLDDKCAKVDEAVRIREDQIALLRERRQILIQQAVTRGLNPSAPMKDSGIDWIGQIPIHWSLDPVRANFLFRNEKNNPVKTEHILSLSIAHGVTPYSEEGRGGNKRKDDLSAYKLAYPGDIVLNSMNVIVGAVGLSKFFGAISPVYYALYAARSDVNVAFYDYIFSNVGFQKGLLRYGKGIMMKLSGTGQLNTIRMKISQDDLKNLPLPTPPIEEQVAIVDFINASSQKIEEGIAIKQEQIAALKGYKNSLINAAVTGKIKVGDHMEPSSR
jgi:type I restriction enzyme S subunit